LELGVDPAEPLVAGAAGLILDSWRPDGHFREAFDALTAKLVDGQVVVERVVPKLARLSFCAKGKPSELATDRYREIVANIGE
jgi:hypothetical protein